MGYRVFFCAVMVNLAAATAAAQIGGLGGGGSPSEASPSGFAASGYSGGGVVVVGTAALPLKPTVLRVGVNLVGRGKDVKTAVADLAQRREKVKTRLADLKANLKSLKIGGPMLDTDTSDQNQRLRASIMVQLRQRRGIGKIELPVIVTVTAPLTVEWPLAAGDDDARTVAAAELQAKITVADLGGTLDMPQLTPEQQELEEETAQSNGSFGANGQDGSSGSVQFLFVAPVTEAQAAKVRADAFAAAKRRAAQWAQAAGLTLGAVKRIDAPEPPENAFAGSAAAEAGGAASGQQNVPTKRPEAVGADPHEVFYSERVNCVFDLK